QPRSKRAERFFVPVLALASPASVFLIAGCFNRPPEHGTALLIEADTSRLSDDNERERVVAEALESLRKRVAGFGARSSAQRAGTNRILIRVEVAADPQLAAVKRWILRTGL